MGANASMGTRRVTRVFGRMTITMKLILAAVVVNVAGLAASVYFVDTTAEHSLYDLATDGWRMQTGQIAAAAAGGLRVVQRVPRRELHLTTNIPDITHSPPPRSRPLM